ncbi:MAG TPA: hypothetical protein VN113_12810, partial [Caulobacter sp.]|nr:hypothetical protein [Caulobacter sp.]
RGERGGQAGREEETASGHANSLTPTFARAKAAARPFSGAPMKRRSGWEVGNAAAKVKVAAGIATKHVIPAAAQRRAGTATGSELPAVPDRRAARLSRMTGL